MHTPGLIVICGPTATGKSNLAFWLAQQLDTVILSADSRACYRELDLGTAKPSLLEQQQVPHYFIDLCAPGETLTVADYQVQAQALIAQLHSQRLTPLLVGGTGLYIKAITQGLKIPRIPPQPELRSQLQSLGQDQLYHFLQQVDPLSTRLIHPHDQARTLRALEVYYVTGTPLSAQQGVAPPSYPILQIGLDCWAPQALTERIRRRTRKMLEAGLVEEVTHLSQKYGANLPLLDTLGYREIKQYLSGRISLQEAEELIVLHTRQFAKRQRTWFRAIPQIQWLEADDPQLFTQVWQLVQHWQTSFQ